ncbi:MAG: phosphate ABC transporter substrate-binding protein [Myxococcota bacterium]|nr:phosphate ABC transporter substrate-binding protein [Myxococcota bacterium]
MKRLRLSLLCLSLATLSAAGCKRTQGAAAGEGQRIQDIGSDTMVNLAQAWAEAYAAAHPGVSVEVSGGGSGVGIAALINGTADIANSSRKLEPAELERAKQAGREPAEHVVGYDGLAIYVHKNNPLEQISIEQLSQIYAENGKIDSWSALGVKVPGAKSDEIVRVSRQNNSGTYAYFREHVVGKKSDFKFGSLDMNGSKEVVELVGRTPGAIGYSGVGYATPAVKVLRVSKTKDGPAVLPSLQTVQDKSYPISRPMFLFTPPNPPRHVTDYLHWVTSEPGQKIVEATGYVPLSKG